MVNSYSHSRNNEKWMFMICSQVFLSDIDNEEMPVSIYWKYLDTQKIFFKFEKCGFTIKHIQQTWMAWQTL